MIRTEEDGAVVSVILDAPEVKNAFNASMIADLSSAISDAARAESCRCLLITGANGTFCAGRDLSEQVDSSLDAILKRESQWEEIFQQLRQFPKLSVAVVEGYAVAGGFTLAMGCDFVISDSKAVFGAFEMRNGFPAAVNTPLLAKLVAPRLALEWALLGEAISARRLYEMGLINRLAEDPEELSEVANTFISHLTTLNPTAVRAAKEIHHAARNMPLADALVMGAQQNSLISASGWLTEGMKKYSGTRREK
ncbi:MAG: enoyl-CoA hydratase/isomerase family protein [Candidatus Poriferisodalaceae bacterium]|nr:MAG: hypothetical protein CNE88_01745 [Acidimicrobiales bacterium MED-G01]